MEKIKALFFQIKITSTIKRNQLPNVVVNSAVGLVEVVGPVCQVLDYLAGKSFWLIAFATASVMEATCSFS